MKTKFELMRANRERVLKVPASFPALPEAPEVPYMEIDGVKYVEAPEPKRENTCQGCAFDAVDCYPARHGASVAFGASCYHRRAIYIKAAS